MSELDYIGNERTRARRAEGDPADAAQPLHSLHASIGNGAIARMLQREAPDDADALAKHDPALAQRAPAPDEEKVEDETAMAKHDPALAQRAPAPDEEKVEDETAMAKHDPALAQRQAAPEVGMAGGGLSAGLSGRIDAQRGGGSALDEGTKSTMEDTLGAPLDGVRVHVGEESDNLNRSITAKAFTTGNDVFVRSDNWAPGSSSTQRLLAHELTHVVQQRSMPGDSGGMSVGAADTHEEREADDVADTVMQRAAEPVQRDADHDHED